MTDVVRAEITVKGKVQKVNFRNFAKENAKKLHLVGTAVNLKNYDEDVAIICEGPKSKIDHYVENLRKNARPPIRIDALEVTFLPSTNAFDDFNFERSNDVTLALGERLDCLLEYMKLFEAKLDEINKRISKLQEDKAETTS